MQDLTEAVKTARRGLKRDVRALCEALQTGILFLPLARALRSRPGEYTVTNAEGIFLHLMPARDGTRFGAAFTREAFLSQCGQQMRWTTDGGALQLAEMDARTALGIFDDLVVAKEIQGLALNPMQPEEVVLDAQETVKLLRGESFPMPRYIRDVPVQKDERFLEGDPAKTPPPALIAVLDALIGEEFLGYTLRQTFNEDRDLEPHLIMRARTSLPPERHSEMFSRIQRAIKDHVPPPGYLDIFFEVPQ